MDEKPRVILVDDEEETLDLLKTLLEIEGFAVFSYAHPNEVPTELISNSLVLSDAGFTDGISWDQIEQIFAGSKMLIGLTGTAQTAEELQDRRRAGETWIDGFTKPYNVDQVIATLKDTSRHKQIY